MAADMVNSLRELFRFAFLRASKDEGGKFRPLPSHSVPSRARSSRFRRLNAIKLILCFLLIFFGIPLLYFLSYLLRFEIKLASSLSDGVHSEWNPPGKTIPDIIHIAWIGMKPLSPIAISTLDSIARHRPTALVKIHITTPENIPPAVYLSDKSRLQSQLDFFVSRGMKMELVIYNDISVLLNGTSLESSGLKQRHLGGMYGVKAGASQPSHASDILRALTVLKDGGTYLDTDSIQVKSMIPLMDKIGAMYVTTDTEPHVLDKDHPEQQYLASGVFASVANHPFLLGLVERLVYLLESKSPDCWFEWDADSKLEYLGGCGWSDLGPLAFTKVSQAWCYYRRDGNAPVVINGDDLTSLLASKQPIAPQSYVILSPAFVNPLHYTRRSFFQVSKKAVADPRMAYIYQSKLSLINNAYQIHVFTPHKTIWLEMLTDPEEYPLAEYIHSLSCFHLCKMADFKAMYEGGRREI